MPRLRPRLAGLVVAAVLVPGAAPRAGADAGDEPPRIYKWVDRNGIAHYTTDPERVPAALRDRIESLGRSDGGREPEAAGPRAEPGESGTSPAPEQAAAPEPAPEAAPSSAPEPAPEAAPRVEPVPAPEGLAPAATPAEEPSEPPPPAPRREVAAPEAGPPSGGSDWVTRDAVPRAPSGAATWLEGEAELTPGQRDALAAEREALDARIAELEAEVRRDENVLKDLISDPDADADTAIFDRPEFLEISKRLPELQAQLDALRSQRERLERN